MNPQQIGCSPGYTFAHYRLEATLERYLWSIDRVEKLGYKNFGLEILEPEHVALYRQPGAISRILERSYRTGVNLAHFTLWHCCTSLTSSDLDRRKLGVRQFSEGVEIAKQLSIPLVAIGSAWPPEWVRSYSPEYEHAPAAEYFTPSTTEYEHLWTAYSEAMRQCLEIAEKESITLGLEPRANSLVSTADSFLRLWEKLGSEQLRCVLDMMHCAFQRENVPVAIKKLGPRLAILQVCGTDGRTLNHLPLDPEDVGLKRAIASLAEIGFTGTVDIELYGMPVEIVDDCYRNAREILERHIMGSTC